MKITVFGSGYVGLVTGACLANIGHEVVCMDIDQEKIEDLQNGVIPIYEPGLDLIIKENYLAGRLSFTTDVKKAVAFGELQFIAVGTPPDESGASDLRYVLAVARSIAEHMDEPKIVIDKSTVPVGTADKVVSAMTKILGERGSTLSFEVCSNPEFLKEGSAILDFTKPSRIIIGTESDYVISRMRECYGAFVDHPDNMICMDVRSAEFTKYAANTMLASKISLMNEFANIAEHFGVDIENVRKGIGSDPRIGYSFIQPGCGYGGSCFPKDVQALSMSAASVGYEAHMLKAIEKINRNQKTTLFAKLSGVLGRNLNGKTIAVWGLSFKPNTDDMREAPSRVLMESVWAAGGKVQAYDPESMTEARRIYGQREDLALCGDRDAALSGAHALVICTEWDVFREADLHFIKSQLAAPLIVDGRNIYDPEKVRDAGLMYFAVGRASSLTKIEKGI